jgi:plastocyanin
MKGGFMKNAGIGVLLVAIALSGCGSRAVAPAMVSDSNAPLTVAFSDNDDTTTLTAHVGLRLNGESSITDKRYGFILGYFNGKTSTKSEVVIVPHGEDIRFFNVDTSAPHTASFLGKATSKAAPFPSSFDGSATQSPAGTAIGTTNFSTGVLSPGSKSLVYTTGAPGFYMFGCAIHYNSNMMRTVIIVE